MFERIRNAFRNMSKRWRVRILASLIVALASTGLAFAVTLLTSKASFNNTFTYAQPELKLTNNSNGDYGEDTVTLTSIKSTNPNMILRVSYIESFQDNADVIYPSNVNTEGYPAALNKSINDELDAMVGAIHEGEIITDAFVNLSEDDGWWYYKKVLKPGESVTLLKEINLTSAGATAMYGTANLRLVLYYEVCEAIPDAAQSLWGKAASIDIGEGTVEW